MSEHTAMQQDIRELRTQRDQAWEELAVLKVQIRGVIGTASAEAGVITGEVGSAGDWMSVVRVYAEALESIGVLVDA